MPTSSATARAVRSLSPVRSTVRNPSRWSSATAAALDGFTVSATTKTARASPSHAATTAVEPLLERRARDRRRAVTPHSASSAGRPTTTAWPSTTPSAPSPSRARKPSTASSGLADGRSRSHARRGAPTRARARRRSQRLGPRRAGHRDHVDERQLALGDRARLVEHDRVDPAGRLEHLRPLDQDAELRATAGADEQRRRRCEAECARARDDQHRDGRREGERRVGAAPSQ